MSTPKRPLWRVILTTLLALAVVWVPSGASAATGGATLSSSGSGLRWTAATLQVDGQKATSRLTVRQASTPTTLSARSYLDGKLLSAASVTVRSAGGSHGIVVDTPTVAGVDVLIDTTEPDDSGRFAELSVELTVNPSGPSRSGRLTMVVYAASASAASWHWDLTTAPGAVVLGTSDGAETFLRTTRDFKASELSVYASQTVPDAVSLAARVNRGARLQLALDPRFVGAFSTFGTDQLRVTGPLTNRDCSTGCDFDPTTPGRLPLLADYVFGLDGSGLTVASSMVQLADTDVSLHGAIVRPPVGNKL